eukprot:PhF_6_TR29112/c0_g1_i1/m.42480/K02685/PRI2; DNA primase large subunit
MIVLPLQKPEPSTNTPKRDSATLSGTTATPPWHNMYIHRPTHCATTTEVLDEKCNKTKISRTSDQITLTDMESLMRERVHLLADIEMAKSSGGPGGINLVERIGDIIRENTHKSLMDPQRDQLSHYLCRLAFCQSEHLRIWFVKNEELIFKWKVSSLTPLEQEKLFAENGLSATLMTQADIQKYGTLQDRLEMLLSRHQKKASDKDQAGKVQWYRVPFIQALDAVRKREVVVFQGHAFLQHGDVLNMLYELFHSKLIKSLSEAMQSRLLLLESDMRDLVFVLDAIVSLDAINATKSQTAEFEAGTIRPGEIEELSKKHFPPCMLQLQDQLKRDRHLKFHGRWQYGTFLKRIGLSMEDAIEFFGNMDAMGPDAFKKSSYAYSIRHYYGKEGKHTSYSAMSCGAIITGAPPSSQSCHGCPFRHLDENQLRRMVSLVSSNPNDIEDVVASSKGQHYTRACHQYFKITHPYYSGESLFTAPVQYFEASTSMVKPLPGKLSEKKRDRDDEKKDPVLSVTSPMK